MAALAAVLEPRTAARHVRVDDRDLVVDTVVRRARGAKTAGRRAREHLDQRFQRARERLNLPLAAHGWQTGRVGAVRDPELVGPATQPLRGQRILIVLSRCDADA